MTDDNQLSFNLPSVSRKKVTAAFDGGRLSSDAGVMLLALAERCRKVADTLAAHIADRRDLLRITHTVADVLRARMLAIGCGYPDGNDFDWLRRDAAFKLACGRLPDTGRDLCSQPTISRWENAPTLREIIRLTYALVDIWCRSYQKPPPSVVLDIDDTVEVARAFAEHGAAGIDVSTGQVVSDEKPAFGRSYQTPFADRIRNEIGRKYGIAVIAVGAISCNSSKSFGPISLFNDVAPVTLPPGRLRLTTRCVFMGSPALKITMGVCLAPSFTFAATG